MKIHNPRSMGPPSARELCNLKPFRYWSSPHQKQARQPMSSSVRLIYYTNVKNMNPESPSFQLINAGKEGTILYQESNHVLVLEWEIAGSHSDILFYGSSFSKWSSPKGSPIPVDKQIEILDQLRIWLNQNNIKSNIDLPENITTSGKKCSWAGCNNSQLGDKRICLYHFNLSCLGMDST